jgi:hypothetical protein
LGGKTLQAPQCAEPTVGNRRRQLLVFGIAKGFGIVGVATFLREAIEGGMEAAHDYLPDIAISDAAKALISVACAAAIEAWIEDSK